MKRFVPAAAALFVAAPAFAHPGHGPDGGSYSLGHFLTTPEHIGLALLIVVAAAGVFALARRRAR